MKKTLLLFTSVACVGLAQAVTYSWSTLSGNATSSNHKFATTAITFRLAASGGSIASTCPTSGQVALQQIVFAARDNNQYQDITSAKLFNAAGVEVGTTTSVSYEGSVTLRVQPNTSYTLTAETFTFANLLLDTTETYTLKFYSAEGTQARLGYSVVKPKGEVGALLNDWTPAMEITVMSIPEPTALALLALGVAGLALRRKVA